ncbi:ORF1185 [White spot syndrome virus]|uniref:Wsv101 n=3 Tax=White spot syndrome virus TaxID=342409 RepID=A0A0A0Y6S7_WSSVS|nr:wsv101 [Shrimp white spot syndrome virus]AFX59478.1 wsv101 [White spot syndrome virus]AAL89025.1 WSSV157 [Shrimp white spot syndrome virus]AIX03666.1 wsv101 [Shrimp white spot syndrome virus]ATU83592.1 ORF1185 [White spot syndrome virus]AWQ60289.1 wsv101 [Shrimp white spot syndrome virus]
MFSQESLFQVSQKYTSPFTGRGHAYILVNPFPQSLSPLKELTFLEPFLIMHGRCGRRKYIGRSIHIYGWGGQFSAKLRRGDTAHIDTRVNFIKGNVCPCFIICCDRRFSSYI